MPRRIPSWVATTLIAMLVMATGATAAWAQASSGLTGRVTDNTGGVLPGVTISAECECLGAPRVAVTDGSGRFNITTLPVGVYRVTMTLPGFSTLANEGVELVSNFTGTVNGVLAVGGLEETVTVSGETPSVDIVNVQTQQRQDMDVLEALPTGARDLTALAGIMLGVTPSNANRNDVGGLMSEINTGLVVHGSHGDQGRMNYDGMNTNVMYGDAGGQQRVWKFNTVAVQEMTVDAGGAGADTETGGASLNMIPRDGTNTFSLNSYFTDANDKFATGAIPDSVRDRSNGEIENVNIVKKVWDYAGGAGGAIIRDRMWYYAAGRVWGGNQIGVENHFNKSDLYYEYVADLDNPAFSDLWQRDMGIRITTQASERNRITSSLNIQRGCGCGLALALTSVLGPEAATRYQYGQGNSTRDGGSRNLMYLSNTTWTAPISTSLLLDAGVGLLWQSVQFDGLETYEPGRYGMVHLQHPAKAATFLYGAVLPNRQGGSYDRQHGNDQFSEHASLSYVTGSHNLEIGGRALQADYLIKGGVPEVPLSFIYDSGLPYLVTQYGVPFHTDIKVRSFGLYIQDQWTMNRVTLNLGMRYDYFHSYALPTTLPAGDPFVLQVGPGVGPAYTHDPFMTESTSYPALDSIPKYQDIVPRLGFAYDLRGDGRTAIKASWGKYMMGIGGGDARNRAPAYNIFHNTNRLWFDGLPLFGPFTPNIISGPTAADITGDFLPQCDFTNSAANGECGAVLGVPIDALRSRRSLDPWESNEGWNVREFSYELTLGVQHELTQGVTLDVSYHRNSWHNQQYVWNKDRTAADFGVGQVTLPVNAQLGDRSGSVITGLYDINAASVGLANDVLTKWQDIPGAGDGPVQVFHGVDISINARFNSGALIQGGVSLGRRSNDTCWLNSLPQVSTPGNGNTFFRNDEYCNANRPLWDAQGSQLKFQAIYPLPQGFTLSGNVKSVPGNDLNANVNVAASAVEGLGRATTAGQTFQVNANPNGYRSDDRVNQIDLRLTKDFNLGNARLNIAAELYNVFNARPVQGTNDDIGARYLFPEGLLGGRFFKYVLGVDF